MLLDLAELIPQHDLNITGILHVGAHLAEEASLYNSLGIQNVWWIEGNEDNISPIRAEVHRCGLDDDKVILALIADSDGKEFTFNITNYDSMSSSIYEFGTHTRFSPDTVFVEHRPLRAWTIDTVVEANGIWGVNFLNMDLQGAELLALKGATKLLREIDYIYTEVNNQEVYLGCAQIGDLDLYLSDFQRVETGWVPRQGWGDALYVRRH